MSKVKKLREQKNTTQREMAQLIKQSKANYCKKENGDIRFSLPEAKIISDFFDDTIENIFFDSERAIIETNDTA